MKCPKCGNEQPDVFSQCQKCRHIFRKISVADAGRPFTDPVAAHNNYSSFPESRPTGLLVASGVLLMFFSIALWWLYTPEGLPVPEGSFINSKKLFAITPPPDWIILSPENYDEMFKLYGNRFQENLREGLSQRKVENGFIKILPEGEFSPSVNIVVANIEVSELSESNKDDAAKTLGGEYAKVFEKYVLEKNEILDVDDLQSLRMESRASLKLITAPAQAIQEEIEPGMKQTTGYKPAEWKTIDLKFIQVIVPGNKKGFIITCSAEASQFAQYKSTFNKIIDSFRVVERPARFGSLVMTGAQSGLIGGITYLLYYLLTGILRRLRR